MTWSVKEGDVQNQTGHLMLFTQQKSYFYTTEILFQTVKEV